jgi:hypothetical protein
MLNKEQVEKLLGRSLTTSETDNFDLYLKIATERLEELLCMQLCGSDDDRTFMSREGYRTLYMDVFTDLESVTIDGNEVDEDDYVVKQNDSYSGSWFNSIEFERPLKGKKVVVSADWGFDTVPVDLQLLLARLFDQGSKEQSDKNVKSKKIEDFTVTYENGKTMDDLANENSSVIQKYSLCSQGQIRSGEICYPWRYTHESI